MLRHASHQNFSHLSKIDFTQQLEGTGRSGHTAYEESSLLLWNFLDIPPPTSNAEEGLKSMGGMLTLLIWDMSYMVAGILLSEVLSRS